VKKLRTYLVHIGLFFITFLTTTLVGAEHVTGKLWLFAPAEHALEWADLSQGLVYSVSFLTFLTFHEFGHYFTAIYYKVKTSLPYYIPIWIPGMLNIGSFGAIIRLEETPNSTQKFFDIGIAGPLAGFVVSVMLIISGLMTLPSPESYILKIHPEYVQQFGGVPNEAAQTEFITKYNAAHPDSAIVAFSVGSNLLFEGLKRIVPHNHAYFPTSYELMHYPLLFVGFLTLFFTALNLLPIGQLDGGHVIYGMFGRKNAAKVAKITVILLLFFGGTGFATFQNLEKEYYWIAFYLILLLFVINILMEKPQTYKVVLVASCIFLTQILLKLYLPFIQPNLIWLIYSVLSVRFIDVEHPPALHEHIVNRPRQILGWIAIIIFILCFTPSPLSALGE
jgi:membrane-associated protease RseP (regulator of RpoE activity)